MKKDAEVPRRERKEDMQPFSKRYIIPNVVGKLPDESISKTKANWTSRLPDNEKQGKRAKLVIQIMQ